MRGISLAPHSYKNREKQILQYLPLVENTVRRIDTSDPAIDKEDLIGFGILGLMDAIEKYDPSKKVPFEAYASIRIRGAVIDELRKAGKVSSDRISKLNEYYRCKEKLKNHLMRTPSDKEICEEMGIDDKQLVKIYETAHFLGSYSLDTIIFAKNGEDFSLLDTIADDSLEPAIDGLVKEETKQMLIKSIEQLNDREKTILNLYYVEKLTLKEIAYILDISIPRVSQIHGRVLIKLREKIEKLQGGSYV
jgi:RNA polymerase sigma factor for flagellar operon FliA